MKSLKTYIYIYIGFLKSCNDMETYDPLVDYSVDDISNEHFFCSLPSIASFFDCITNKLCDNNVFIRPQPDKSVHLPGFNEIWGCLAISYQGDCLDDMLLWIPIKMSWRGTIIIVRICASVWLGNRPLLRRISYLAPYFWKKVVRVQKPIFTKSTLVLI